MGRGSRATRRWAKDRQRKKKERVKRNAPQPPEPGTRSRRKTSG